MHTSHCASMSSSSDVSRNNDIMTCEIKDANHEEQSTSYYINQNLVSDKFLLLNSSSSTDTLNDIIDVSPTDYEWDLTNDVGHSDILKNDQNLAGSVDNETKEAVSDLVIKNSLYQIDEYCEQLENDRYIVSPISGATNSDFSSPTSHVVTNRKASSIIGNDYFRIQELLSEIFSSTEEDSYSNTSHASFQAQNYPYHASIGKEENKCYADQKDFELKASNIERFQNNGSNSSISRDNLELVTENSLDLIQDLQSYGDSKEYKIKSNNRRPSSVNHTEFCGQYSQFNTDNLLEHNPWSSTFSAFNNTEIGSDSKMKDSLQVPGHRTIDSLFDLASPANTDRYFACKAPISKDCYSSVRTGSAEQLCNPCLSHKPSNSDSFTECFENFDQTSIQSSDWLQSRSIWQPNSSFIRFDPNKESLSQTTTMPKLTNSKFATNVPEIKVIKTPKDLQNQSKIPAVDETAVWNSFVRLMTDANVKANIYNYKEAKFVDLTNPPTPNAINSKGNSGYNPDSDAIIKSSDFHDLVPENSISLPTKANGDFLPSTKIARDINIGQNTSSTLISNNTALFSANKSCMPKSSRLNVAPSAAVTNIGGNISAPPHLPIQTFCGFCRNNGESEIVYKSHKLKDSFGRVSCPVLRSYTCPICSSSGDSAHTIKYCPMNSKDEALSKFKVHETPRTSAGKRRLLKLQASAISPLMGSPSNLPTTSSVISPTKPSSSSNIPLMNINKSKPKF